ncbi:MAG: 2Fe-2S iron-sulfur cluster binding domain-containing protein [Reyranella sp.]|nr:2Fe-2S iron-sulfur cluster binding domain-containing protein [Reyranella sp.]
MPQILFQLSDGSEMAVDTDVGQSVMRAALTYGVPGIDGECGGTCSCATCHVRVDPAWTERVGPPGETEADMLEFEAEAASNSRLGCQIIMTEALSGLRLHVVRS